MTSSEADDMPMAGRRTLTGSQLNGVLVEVDVVAYLGPITTS
jgi:hypothetical protein